MELDDLYREILIDHYRHPRNAGPVDDAELAAEELNPTCGDRVRLAVELKDGRIERVCHQSRGCVISTASASMMSEFARGLTPQEFAQKAGAFIAMMRGEAAWRPEGLEDLAALEGVKKYPLRIKCATMCWHALKTAMGKTT